MCGSGPFTADKCVLTAEGLKCEPCAVGKKICTIFQNRKDLQTARTGQVAFTHMATESKCLLLLFLDFVF